VAFEAADGFLFCLAVGALSGEVDRGAGGSVRMRMTASK
jgi:hypothetical protein